jgi:diaminopimelate epimerase
VNFEVVSIQARDELTMRVWERGAGITLACGSGACAAMAVARRQGLVDDTVRMHLPGGGLQLWWDGAAGIRLTGPAAYVFRGEWPLR